MIHVMLDLETWGLTPGSDIRSIGAVVFDSTTNTLGDEFYLATENPNVGDRGYYEPFFTLTRDPGTEDWWSYQSEEAQSAFENPVRLDDALVTFTNWLLNTCPDPYELRIWAHGSHFDIPILEACYRACGQSVPWFYRAPRDTRTIHDLTPNVVAPEFTGIAHHALDDAKYQALYLMACLREISQ